MSVVIGSGAWLPSNAGVAVSSPSAGAGPTVTFRTVGSHWEPMAEC